MLADDIVYDLETFPNWFTAKFIHARTGQYWSFEVSDRRDDSAALLDYLDHLRARAMDEAPLGLAGRRLRLVGFNCRDFDYPILHRIMLDPQSLRPDLIAAHANDLISGAVGRWRNVPDWEVLIPMLDLFLVHMFSRPGKSCGLKQLEFAMRSQIVMELPFVPGEPVPVELMVHGDVYGFHDIAETLRFYHESKPEIDMRDELGASHGVDYACMDDIKLGKEYFIKRLEAAAPGTCYEPDPDVPGRRRMRGTERDYVDLGECVLPEVTFSLPECQRALAWFRQQRVIDGERPGLTITLGGLQVSLGIGGVHGSVLARSVLADEEHCLLDIDVSGYYPSLAIAKDMYPEHCGPVFVEVNKALREERRHHKKGSAENTVLKFAGNGIFGQTGNRYCPVYDPRYLLWTTVNGQLLQLMLAEQLLQSSQIELIQMNTDGMTLRCPRSLLPWIRDVMGWWERLTGLELEQKMYSRMHIRDVNAYIAVSEDGKKIKRKSAFAWVHGPNLGDGELAWYQDHSALVVPMAAEACLLRGADVDDFVYRHPDPLDFLSFVKTQKDAHLELGDRVLGRILRYHVALQGEPLCKIMPPGGIPGDFKISPKADWAAVSAHIEKHGAMAHKVWDPTVHTKNKSQHHPRKTRIEAGRLVRACNDLADLDPQQIDRSFYAAQAKELVASVGWSTR